MTKAAEPEWLSLVIAHVMLARPARVRKPSKCCRRSMRITDSIRTRGFTLKPSTRGSEVNESRRKSDQISLSCQRLERTGGNYQVDLDRSSPKRCCNRITSTRTTQVKPRSSVEPVGVDSQPVVLARGMPTVTFTDLSQMTVPRSGALVVNYQASGDGSPLAGRHV